MALSTLVGTTTQPGGGNGATRVVTTTFRPKLVLLAWTTDGTLDTFISGTSTTDGSTYGMGGAAEDGGSISQGCITIASADGIATSDTGRHVRNDSAFAACNSAGTLIAAATVTVSDTDFTLTFGTNDNVARNIAYLVVGGGTSAVQFKVVEWSQGTGTGSGSITTVGWQPTFAIDLNIGSPNTLNAGTTGLNFCPGMRSGASNEVAFFFSSTDGSGTGAVAKAQRDDSLNASYATSNNTGPTQRVEHTSFDANGFTWNVITFNSNRKQITIVGKGVDAVVGMLDKSTGGNGSTQDITAQGWAPEAMVLMTVSSVTQGTPGNTTQASNQSSGMSIGFWDGGTSEASVGHYEVHGPTNMVAKQRASATKVLVKSENNAPSVQAEADASAVAGGVRLTWSTNDAVAADIGYLLLRETSTGTPATMTVDTATAPAAGEAVALTGAAKLTATEATAPAAAAGALNVPNALTVATATAPAAADATLDAAALFAVTPATAPAAAAGNLAAAQAASLVADTATAPAAGGTVALTGAGLLTVATATAPAQGEGVTLDAAAVLTVAPATAPADGGGVTFDAAGTMLLAPATAPAEAGTVGLGAGEAASLTVSPATASAAADGAFSAAAAFAAASATATAAADAAFLAAAVFGADAATAPAAAAGDLSSGPPPPSAWDAVFVRAVVVGPTVDRVPIAGPGLTRTATAPPTLTRTPD